MTYAKYDSSASRAAEFPRLLIWLVQAIIVLAPLPLASNKPFFTGLLIISCALALLLWSWHNARNQQGELLEWRKLLFPGVCIGLSLVWMVLQVLPFPAPLAHPIWNDVATQLMNSAPIGSISVDPATSRSALLKLLAYVMLFAVTVQLARSQMLASRLLKTIAVAVLVYAGYGLVNYAMGNAYILWLPKEDYLTSLTGTFINRNAFAAFLGVGLLACVALVCAFLHRELDGAPKRNLLPFLFSQARPIVWVALIGLIIIPLALLLTTSRAGMASILIGLAVLWLGLFVTRLIPRKALLILALISGTGLGALLTLSGDRLIARTDKTVFAQEERLDIWRSTQSMIEAAPLTGQGLGTYPQLYHLYRTPELQLVYTKAHNSYLEFAAEIGVPATLLWFVALFALGWRMVIGIRTRRQGQIYPLFALAVGAQAASHALVDFSFQIPANAALLAVVLAIGTAQSFRSRE
jgi:O-antigen ligase